MKKAVELKTLRRAYIENEALKTATRWIQDLVRSLENQTGDEWSCTAVHGLKDQKHTVFIRNKKISLCIGLEVKALSRTRRTAQDFQNKQAFDQLSCQSRQR